MNGDLAAVRLNREFAQQTLRTKGKCLFTLALGRVVGSSRLELPTSRLSGARSNQLSYEPIFFTWYSPVFLPTSVRRTVFDTIPGGDEGNRTLDPLLARQVLSHLSYTPMSGAAYMIL